MISNFRKKSRRELLRTSIFPQTAFWSEVKKNMGVESLAFDFSVHGKSINNEPAAPRNTNSDVLVLISHVGNNSSIAYVPYGACRTRNHINCHELCRSGKQLFQYSIDNHCFCFCLRNYIPDVCPQ